MRLPPNLKRQFDEYISKTQNPTDMIPITEASYGYIDALTKQAYGLSPKEMDKTVTKTIIFLYTQIHLSVEEIADKIEVEAKFVVAILKKHKLIKK